MANESLQFHFDCYALCELQFNEDGDRREVESAKLLGFWRSEDHAILAARGRETLLRSQHKEQYKAVDGRWPAYPWDDPGYAPNHYEVVPLASVRFDDLADLQDAIEAAALARFNGIGVDVAVAGGAR